ncbi:phage tail terminator-like protein [Rhizobium sp.]|jgi:hypothetical protein|uniref:phage tail terminator-like protein n=1 Tax=Rhizobium sp. TaxID=391 RepID=UPI000E8519BF|nr:hypothetical protein [Rhizobium sp.]
MASPEVFEAFQSTLNAGWTTTGIVYENDFDQNYTEAGLPFVYVEVYGDTLNQETVGAPGQNMWREEGAAYLHVMVKSGTGSAEARSWAKQLLALFREQSIVVNATTGETLHMPQMSIGAGEPGKDFPEYWAMTVTITWYRRDITGT